MVYFAAGVAIVVGGRRLLPNLRATTFVHAMVDAVAISLMLFASGGIASGLGILFVVPVGAMALLATAGTRSCWPHWPRWRCSCSNRLRT